MPIPASGGNQSNSSKKSSSGGNLVELVLSAKNETNESFGDLQKSLEKAKENTEKLADKFEDLEDTSSDAFKSIRQGAIDLSQEVLPKLRQGIDLTSKSFQSLITIADKSLSVFNGVFEAIDNIYEIATSDVSSAFFSSLAASANQAIAKVDSLSNIISALRSPNVNFAKGIGGAEAIDKIYQKLQSISPLLDSIDSSFSRTVRGIRDGSGYATQGIDLIVDSFGSLSNIQAPLSIFSGLQETIGNTVNVVSEVSQRVFFFMGALEQLKGVVLGGPFDLLIGQNARLQEQLLGIQSTLAATTTLLRGTQEIGLGGQVTEKILSLAAPVNNVLAKIRQDSLELVGVTSNELVDVFNIVTQSLTDVNLSLKEAGDLTISFAASLGTLGIPLYQARQEIQSILQGQIDQNSALAKSIGLTNTQLKSWISQDKVYERLTERLAAFKEGNALAAQTIGGLTSNIREIADEIGRASGAKFLSPIVDQIGEVYRFLLKNQAAITETVSEFLDRFASASGKVKDGIVGLGTALAPLSKEIGRLFSETIVNVISGIGDGLKTITKIAEPFLAIVGKIAKVVASTPLVSLYAQMKVLSGAFGVATRFAGNFATVLPVVGQGLGFLQLRSLPVINAFSNLSAAFGGNISAAVTLGASLTKIPIVMKLMSGAVQDNILGFGKLVASGEKLASIPIAASIASNGAVMQMLAAGTVAATPALLNFAKTGLALAKNFGFGRAEIGQFTAKLPGLISLITTSSSKIPVFGAQISGLLSGLADKYQGQITTIANSGVQIFDTIDQQIQSATVKAGAQIKQMIVTFGLWAAAAFLVGNAINELIIKNENFGLAVTFLLDKLKEFASFIGDALSNPLGILASAVLGVTIAIKSGLVAQLQSMAVATAKAISPQLLPALSSIATTLKGLDKVFVGFVGRIKEATKEQDALAKAIANQEKAQQAAGIITERESKNLSSLNRERKNAKKKFTEATDPAEKQKAAQAIAQLDADIADQAAKLRDRRQGAFNKKRILDKDRRDLKELGEKRAQLVKEVSKETDPSKYLELSTDLERTDNRIKDKRKTLNQRRRAFLDQQDGLDTAKAAVDQAKLAQTTSNTFGKVSKDLNAAKAAAKGLSTTIGTTMTAAFNSVGAAIGKAGVAIKAFLIEFAPLIAIGAAVGVVVTAFTNWAALEAKKSQGIKDYNDRLKETITSLEEIKRIQEGTEPVGDRITPETAKELEAQRLYGDAGVRKIRERTEGRNFLQVIGEGLNAGLLGGGDLRAIGAENISDKRVIAQIESDISDRLASDPYAKDGSGLNPEVMAEIRRNQELAAEVAQLNKEGKDDQARMKQAELESSSRRLSDLEKTFSDSKEYLKRLDLSGEDAQRRDSVVDKLTYFLNQLAGAMEGTIAPMRTIEQGTGTALNLTQFQQAQRQFARGGDPAQLERYASLLMGSAGELVGQGQLDPEKAIDAVKKLAESTGLDAKTTKAAQEQMVQFWSIATKRILQEEENRQSGLDLLRQKGLVSERQYLEESISIIEARLQKQKELSLKGQQQQIEVIRVQEREQLRLIRQQLKEQEDELNSSIQNPSTSEEDKKSFRSQLSEARIEAGRQEAEIAQATADEIQQLRLDYESEYTAMMIAAEKERQDARIKIVQQMQDKLNDQLAYSEEMRNQNLTRITNEKLIFEEEADLIRTQSTDRRIEREIEAEKAIRNERMKTPALFEAEIRKSDIKIAQLTQQRIENEGKAWDAQIAALKRNLKYRVDLFVNSIEEENKALLGQQKYVEAMQNTLGTRNQILGSAKGIVDETVDAVSGTFTALGESTFSENTQKVLQNVAEQQKLDALQKTAELEKQMFNVQLEQNRLALRRQEIELKLTQIEEQRLTLEKKAALEVAQKAAEEKPGDRQALLDVQKAKRDYELQLASFGLTSIGIELNAKEQQLAAATDPLRIANKDRQIQNEIGRQEAIVSKGGNPLQVQQGARQAMQRLLGVAFEDMTQEQRKALSNDPDSLYLLLRGVQQNGVSALFPGMRGQSYSFNDYTSNRGLQQQAVLNGGARFGATSTPNLNEASSGYDAIYGSQVPLNPQQTKVGAAFDEVNKVLDGLNAFDETVMNLGEGAIPTFEGMLESAGALIDEQFPAFKDAMDEINADQLPTATTVLDELGTRLQTFSEEDLPGMQDALTGVQDTAIAGIDTIVLKLEEETVNLTEAIAMQFETVWQGILDTIVLPPSGKLPEAKDAAPEAIVLTPEQQAAKNQLDIESKQKQIEAINARITQANNRDDIPDALNFFNPFSSDFLDFQERAKNRTSVIDYFESNDRRGTETTLLREERARLSEEIKTLRTQQAEMPDFAPTRPAGNTVPWWHRAGRENGNTQASKTFNANIVAHAKTVEEGRAIGKEIATWMREVFYKADELTA